MTTGASVSTPGLAVDSMMLGFQSCKFIRVCMIYVLFNPRLLHACLHLFFQGCILPGLLLIKHVEFKKASCLMNRLSNLELVPALKGR